MAILQAGIAKSGNFWLYKILQSVIRHGGLETKSFIKQHPIYELARLWDLPTTDHADIDTLEINKFQCVTLIWPIFREPVDDIDSYINSCSHVWTHAHLSEYALTVLPKFDKIVYILRDPRDVAVSMSRFAFTPYYLKHCPHKYRDAEEYLADRLQPLITNWAHHVGNYLRFQTQLNIHILFYERLLQSFEPNFLALLKYLGVTLGPDTITEIVEEVGFETMRSQNPEHVRKGRSGQWVNVLSEEQNRQTVEIAGSLLEYLNFPLDKESVGHQIPRLPGDQ